jgi:3-methyl-2-oxobutanoate hydroxymethyltransferase
LAVPTIGIGAGQKCDGQVLVFHDVLGIFDKFTPKFVRPYANLRQTIVDAFKAYIHEVETGAFPDDDHSFSMSADELQKLKTLV